MSATLRPTSRPPAPRHRALSVLLVPAVLLAVVLPLGLVAGPVQAARDGAPVAARAARPAVVETRVLGQTVRGRDIVAWRVGDPDATTKVVLMSAIHGDETGPSRILRRIRDGAPVTGADVWVIPVLNLDGDARNTRTNAHGVDLNRNWPVSWRHLTGHYYSGPRAASEPETKALMAFLAQISPTYLVSFHQPLNGVDTSSPKDHAFARGLARALGLPRKYFSCGSPGCHGTLTQWFNATLPGTAVTAEYGTHLSARQLRTAPDALLRAVGAHR